MPLTRAEVAGLIDHTLLKPEATPADVQALCADAVALGVLAVCVSPSVVPVAKAALAGSAVRLACVVGFPSGAHHSSVKAAEARLAVEQGVDEVDMVIDLGRAKSGDWAAVQADIEAVRRAAPEP
ncbi:MAG TPA: deoxyribose-phosphate aldolase, partial [Acidimicrobiales bacterium]